MKTDLIKRLITILKDEEIDEIEVGNIFSRVRIVKKRASEEKPEPVLGGSVPMVPAETRKLPPEAEEVKEEPLAPENAILHEILSPMVGTFYRSSAPGRDPFVSVGKKIRKGEIICIIEAMKLMNEIEAEVEGVIREVLVEDAHPVEYGQPLFVIEPA